MPSLASGDCPVLLFDCGGCFRRYCHLGHQADPTPHLGLGNGMGLMTNASPRNQLASGSLRGGVTSRDELMHWVCN